MWVKIDDQFYAHPKLIAAGPLAKCLFVDALCYANQYLTDGFIPATVALQISMPLAQYTDAAAVITRLVDAGLWHKIDGGYQIHDYLDYNPSREHVLRERAAAKERMQRVRGAKPAINGENPRSPEVRPNIDRSSEMFARSSSYPVPDPVPVVLSEQENPPTPQGGETRPKLESIDGGKKPPSSLERRFVIFWEAYPNKTGKQAARRAWDRLKPDDAMLRTMVSAIDRQKRSDQWRREGGRFIPHPTTWLNQGRWEDETGIDLEAGQRDPDDWSHRKPVLA